MIGAVLGAVAGAVIRAVAGPGTLAVDGLPVVGAPTSRPIKLASAVRGGCTWPCGGASFAIGGATGVWLRLCGGTAFAGVGGSGCGGLYTAAGAVGGA
jgi:hypothetical protein